MTITNPDKMQPLETRYPLQQKEGNTGYKDKGGNPVMFKYFVQDVRGKSLSLRNELMMWGNNHRFIGLLFEDGNIAWSPTCPRHNDLEESEGKTGIARFQTIRDMHPVPDVRIHGMSLDAVKAVCSYIRRCQPNPSIEVSIDIVPSFQGADLFNIQRVYMGPMGELNPEQLRLPSTAVNPNLGG